MITRQCQTIVVLQGLINAAWGDVDELSMRLRASCDDEDLTSDRAKVHYPNCDLHYFPDHIPKKYNLRQDDASSPVDPFAPGDARHDLDLSDPNGFPFSS